MKCTGMCETCELVYLEGFKCPNGNKLAEKGTPMYLKKGQKWIVWQKIGKRYVQTDTGPWWSKALADSYASLKNQIVGHQKYVVTPFGDEPVEFD